MTGLAIDYVRPVELGGDKVGSREVILDAMDYADRKGIIYNKVVLLQPTSRVASLFFLMILTWWSV